MPLLSDLLVGYWRTQLARPVGARRREFARVRNQVRSGAAPAARLLPFALGDTDDEIVFRATMVLLRGATTGNAHSPMAAEDAIEWVRRRLALNRAAVFAALLATGQEDLLEKLRPLRLLLDAAETDVVTGRLGKVSAGPARDFLQAWSTLLTLPSP